MVEKKKISRVKGKRKIWFKIIAPKLFGEKEIGESYLTAGDKAVGRVLKVNLRELSGNPKDQNVYLSLRITSLDGSTLKTSTIGYQLTPSFVKRLVRKNADRVDDFLILKTKDGKEIILKLLIITRNKVQRSVKTNLRKQLKELLKEEISKLDFDTFVVNLVNQKIQSGIKKKLHKIYPLKDVSVRVLKLKSELKKEVPKEKVVEAPKKEKEVVETVTEAEQQPAQEAA